MTLDKKPQMLVLDLDGTLLNDQKQFNIKNLSILQNLKKENPTIKFCLATGRAFYLAQRFAQKIEADYLIMNDGSTIYARQKNQEYRLIKAFNLNEQTASQIYDQLKDFSQKNKDLTWCFCTDNFTYNFIITTEKDSLARAYQIFCPHETIFDQHVLEINKFTELQKLNLAQHLVKILVYFGNTPLAQKQEEEFTTFLKKGKDKINSFSPARAMQSIAAPGINKGSALVYLQNRLKEKGLLLQNSAIAIAGNDHNDLAMLKLKGYRTYCPANAIKEVKDLAQITVLRSSNNEPWLQELLRDYTHQKPIPSNPYLEKLLKKAKNNYRPDTFSLQAHSSCDLIK